MDGLFGNSGGFESIIALAVGSILPESWNPGILESWYSGILVYRQRMRMGGCEIYRRGRMESELW